MMDNETQPAESLPSNSAKFAEPEVPDFKFEFGDEVRCGQVGSVRPFIGVVTFRAISGSNEPFYHVRDEFGQYFHRSNKDLVRVDASGEPWVIVERSTRAAGA